MKARLAAVLFLMTMTTVSPFELEAKDRFASIFDGKSLTGWSAPDMMYWSVVDRAITARSTAQIKKL